MDPIANPGWVEAQGERSVALWERAAGPWAEPSPVYSTSAQKLREKAYDRALADVQCIARTSSRSDADVAYNRLLVAFARFAAEALDLDACGIDLLTNDFLPVGTNLARWAHRFDPNLRNEEIAQACRNAWTACGLQPLLGAPMRLTSAILAYSLLYPYTDNYLDQPIVTREQLHGFNKRLRARLQGHILLPANHHEACVWHMVRLIEREFPRMRYPQVFASMLAIHEAQVNSMHQVDGGAVLHSDGLLRITCAKGGTSVLTDATLVHGELDARQADFAFLWGVLLQLGDDLQDVHEDLARGSHTLFTRAVRRREPLDALVSQLLNFSDCVAAQMDALPHGSATHKALLRMSWRSLILMAVALAHEFFSKPFVADLERRSPFRFGFLRSRRKKLDGNPGLFQRLFEILLDGGAPAELPSSLPPVSAITFDAVPLVASHFVESAAPPLAS